MTGWPSGHGYRRKADYKALIAKELGNRSEYLTWLSSKLFTLNITALNVTTQARSAALRPKSQSRTRCKVGAGSSVAQSV